MTAKTINGVLNFVCNSCGDTHDTNTADFAAAFAEVRSQGWTARKSRGAWVHACGSCSDGPTDREDC